jgi:hypothetical protein
LLLINQYLSTIKKIFNLTLLAVLSLNTYGHISWIKYTGNPVLSGTEGQWDQNIDFIGSVLFHDNQYHMWYSAKQPQSDHKVRHATSPDGINWTKDPDNPVFENGDPGS